MNEINQTNAELQMQPEQTANVLIMSRTNGLIRLVLEILARKKILGMVVADAGQMLDFLDKNDCSLAIIDDTDVSTEKYDISELLSKIRAGRPEMPVVMVINSQGDTTGAIEKVVNMIRAGFYDVLAGPVSNDRIERLIDTMVPNRPVKTIDSNQDGACCVYKIVGKSPKLGQTVNLAKRVAATNVAVLISGESGAGKELISYVVHYNSRRAQGPFVKVNCAALSETLLESELFGHEKGAFTGAYSQRKGRFESAQEGTLLLDEISETPLRFQAKLLRVLEQQDLQRVGSNETIRINVRIISTTNKDLTQEIAEGRFRQDLYYRLCGIHLVVAPLRQRPEDLPDLIWHFVNLYAGQVHRRISRLDPAMLELFSKYHWPGNVRQLRNVILTSMILGTGETLSLADASWLFNEIQPRPEVAGPMKEHTSSVISPAFSDRLAGMPLEQLERNAILETLKQTGGNQTMAAKALGISDRTLRDKIKRYRQQGCLQPA